MSSINMQGNARSDVTVGELAAGAVPELDAAIERAHAAFAASPRFVCKHVARGAQDLLICAAHPRLGVQCSACYRRHLDRHAVDDEHRCDRCGQVVDRIVGIGAEARIAAQVRNPSGRRGMLVGRIMVAGLGLCHPCAGMPAESA